MNFVTTVYAVSTVVQIAAMVFALRTSRGASDPRPWRILLGALAVMFSYRILHLLQSNNFVHLSNETAANLTPLVGLTTSLLLMASLSSIRRLEAAERASRREADQRGIERDDALGRLDAAMESGEVATWVWDVPTDRLYADKYLARMFGVSEDQAKGGPLGAYTGAIHPDDRERTTAQIMAATASESGDYQAEYRLPRGDGTWRWVMARGEVQRDTGGRIARMTGVVLDITNRKAGEEERERLLVSERAAREEAERASRMKDEFLATLSHELRTPLNAILGWASLLNPESDATILKQGLAVIERNSRLQTQLIEDLLDMSRIIAGKLRLDIGLIDPSSFIESAIATVQPSADAKEIRLRTVLDPRAGPINGDSSRLVQVVWNLLSNAIKFTPKGGSVQVVLKRVDSHVQVQVSDSGVGIEPEFAPYVFDRFRQFDASSTRRHGGIGLGLAIVKHLVELHGGSVSVESRGVGQGTTFTVRLPLAAVHRAVVEHAPASPAGPEVEAVRHTGTLSGVKVMVVDDEADARDLIRHILQASGAAVHTAGDADEALESIGRIRPDVLVTDIGMPEVDGYELLRRVRRLDADEGGRTPAVALTAFARTEDRTRALMAGFLVHVSKPVEPEELVATIASVAGRTGGSNGSGK